MTSLETVFNDGDSYEEQAVVAEVAEPEPEPKTEAMTDESEKLPETGEEKKAEGSTPDPEPVESESSESKGLKSAVSAERNKRQALQRELDAIKQTQQAKEQTPDVFDDQQGYTAHMTEKMEAAIFNERANISEFFARREYGNEKLESMLDKFESLKLESPALMAQVQNSASPYHEIHAIVSNHEKLEKMQNIDEFEATTRAEIEAKVRAELKAEMEGKQSADKQLRESIPTSLVAEPSKGTVRKPSFAGQTPLANIFGD